MCSGSSRGPSESVLPCTVFGGGNLHALKPCSIMVSPTPRDICIHAQNSEILLSMGEKCSPKAFLLCKNLSWRWLLHDFITTLVDMNCENITSNSCPQLELRIISKQLLQSRVTL